MLQTSIHAYHREVKEAEKLELQLTQQNKRQNKKIKEIQEEVENK